MNLHKELDKSAKQEDSALNVVRELLEGISSNKLTKDIRGLQRVKETLECYGKASDVDESKLLVDLEISRNILNESIRHRKGEIEGIYSERSSGHIPLKASEDFDVDSLLKDDAYISSLRNQIEELEAYKRSIEEIHKTSLNMIKG